MNTNTTFTKELQAFAHVNQISLADAHLTILKEKNLLAKIYLSNGIGLKSPILATNEDFVLLLSRNGGLNLVSRHCIATVQSLGYTDDVEHGPVGEDILDFAMAQLKQDQIHVFLINGIRLDGTIAQYDKESLLLLPLTPDTPAQIIQWKSVASTCKYDENLTRKARF